jgi:hypothetical protein
MSRACNLLIATAFAAICLVLTNSAEAYGPARYVAARPVVRAPVMAVRTARVVAPPYYAPRVYAPARVYVAPPGGPVIYIP